VADDDQPDLSAFEEPTGADPDEGDEGAAESDALGSTGSDAADAASDAAGTEIDAAGTESGPESNAADRKRSSIAELDQRERVELGVDLLAHLETESLPLSEAVDRIESVTTNPSLTREILDTAELRGIIEREDGRLRTRRGGTYVRFDQQVVEREGDFECRRCGASLSTGHFVRFESGELGPFGPSCVRKILGRE